MICPSYKALFTDFAAEQTYFRSVYDILLHIFKYKRKEKITL